MVPVPRLRAPNSACGDELDLVDGAHRRTVCEIFYSDHLGNFSSTAYERVEMPMERMEKLTLNEFTHPALRRKNGSSFENCSNIQRIVRRSLRLQMARHAGATMLASILYLQPFS